MNKETLEGIFKEWRRYQQLSMYCRVPKVAAKCISDSPHEAAKFEMAMTRIFM